MKSARVATTTQDWRPGKTCLLWVRRRRTIVDTLSASIKYWWGNLPRPFPIKQRRQRDERRAFAPDLDHQRLNLRRSLIDRLLHSVPERFCRRSATIAADAKLHTNHAC